jgi:hypothetical protein
MSFRAPSGKVVTGLSGVFRVPYKLNGGIGQAKIIQ